MSLRSLPRQCQPSPPGAVPPPEFSSWHRVKTVIHSDNAFRSASLASEWDKIPREKAFVLHHIEDIPYEEIATITGDSIGSLKVRAHRARKLLKEAISPDAEFVAPGDVAE